MKHICTAALLGAVFATPAAAREVKIGYALAEDSHYGVAAKAFEKSVTDQLGDAFTFKDFPSSGLGGEREVVEGVQLGTVDMTIVSTGTLSNFVPEVGVFDVPFLFSSLDHARRVLDGEIGQEMLARFDEAGLHALAWGEQGFRHITNNRGPITTPADAKGLKIRTMENPVHIKAFEALGAAPTPMAWPEVIGALQQGAIDGQENPLSVIVSAKLNEVQKYLTLDGHVYSPAVILISPALWNSLDDSQKAAFDKAAKDAVTAMRAYVDEVEASGVETLKQAGMQVNELTPDQKAAFRAALEGPYKDYEAQFGKDLMDRIQAEQ
ncbi:MAG: TRAP transporter substrate-binding protein [Paracoccus sp. (in: a-proteobacteria)]|jgi:tripartite ATP-independent transporter DctP family solute receptor|uniref:TRAP transporter substrate-binding protein n=1 Tax=unclassified Paracoccus (in: a-proteobacteria) TaxID=2688777 RepID=UPI000C61615A|nr:MULTISPECIES: TRAP transporter substrate-binding protein [unclassified Paracoccus (in: a-proteobacteria)]MAN56823.1 C4-dicarboxylate ABC transporter substrate-binding protein [Paracoccus sp. (in: a-proteobacteria)]MBA48577.1 C4-dicarboxylate ABC transporter substrate-binding protein [Paracoccus sp. (in: a-proteobacteria)]MCS5603614.1 TRAP transporter substrate-binding protein [Paracoccus sp. (in: a-proteobacteria)]MDB2551553.1 TRAP transporter substrate-binding protein [Paracoccus sp. (in: a|tara:strand:- start:4949 stop:5917 length:969 start_codon:yes stop_codon:yes gene_type:complete